LQKEKINIVEDVSHVKLDDSMAMNMMKKQVPLRSQDLASTTPKRPRSDGRGFP
jgi:hypothetical protein